MKVNETVLVATPVQQHSFQLASALKKAGVLKEYCTTVFIKQDDRVWKHIGAALAKGFQNAILKKTCVEIESETHVVCGFLGLAYYFCSRINDRLADFIYYRLSKRFGKKIAKRAIKEQVSSVVMFDYTAVECFAYLKEHAPKITRILDMSSIPAMSIDAILKHEEQNGYIMYHKSKRSRYSEKYCKYFQPEIACSDYFFVAGEFARSCLIDQGAQPEQCFLIPYGVDTSCFTPDYHIPEDGILHFVYTGRLEAAKGIIYVLDAFQRAFNEGIRFKLHLVGTVDMPMEKIDSCKDFVELHGFLTKEELAQLYHRSQVYVMCSLWEGRSLSIIEALSCGLPSIITTSTGMTDCISDGENGFIVPPANADAIYEKVKWFAEHQKCLSDMSKMAVQSVGEMTWEDYDRNIADAMNTIAAKKNEVLRDSI